MQYAAGEELFDYASPMKNSPGPLFTVKIPAEDTAAPIRRAIVLESVQDPGNVGTVIRTANAFGIDAVILTGNCADLYNPKTVRATMGAIFRQRVLELPLAELRAALDENGLPLYGAALSETARDFREIPLDKAAVCACCGYTPGGCEKRRRCHRKRGQRPERGASGAVPGRGHHSHAARQ